MPINCQSIGKVRFNAEYFGFIVGFPDGEILLTSPTAMVALHPRVKRAEIQPYLLETLDVPSGFYLQTPPLVWLELTKRCDLACPHCYIDGGIAREREMSPERWHEIIDEMADMGVWAVAFTGGEPTLHPSFVELVQHARQRDLLVGIATHGLHLTARILDQLPKDGVILSVSIDSLHVGSNGGAVSTNKSKDAVLRAKEHGFFTNIMTNTHRLNVDDLSSLIKWAEVHEVSVRSTPFSPIGRGKSRKDLENTPSDVERAAQFWLRECEWEHEYHRKAGLCVGVIFNYGLSLAYMTRRCSSARFLCYIAADGTMFPCTMCASEKLFPNLSVQSNSFSTVWRAPWEIRQYSWANFEHTCVGCPINDERFYCASRCPAMSYARNNNYFGCGASQFEIDSTLYRTSLLEKTETGRCTNIPVEASRGLTT